jgi:hypothetical protein
MYDISFMPSQRLPHAKRSLQRKRNSSSKHDFYSGVAGSTVLQQAVQQRNRVKKRSTRSKLELKNYPNLSLVTYSCKSIGTERQLPMCDSNQLILIPGPKLFVEAKMIRISLHGFCEPSSIPAVTQIFKYF